MIAPATITGARPGSSAGTRRRSASGSAASRASCAVDGGARSRWPWTRSRVVLGEPEVERRERRHRAGDADRAPGCERRAGSERTYARAAASSGRDGGSVQEALGQPDAADVEARRGDDLVGREHELGRAAADVDDERVRSRRAPAETPRIVIAASSSPESSRVVKP